MLQKCVSECINGSRFKQSPKYIHPNFDLIEYVTQIFDTSTRAFSLLYFSGEMIRLGPRYNVPYLSAEGQDQLSPHVRLVSSDGAVFLSSALVLAASSDFMRRSLLEGACQVWTLTQLFLLTFCKTSKTEVLQMPSATHVNLHKVDEVIWKYSQRPL